MKLTTKQKWLRTIAWLRRNFPAQRPVTVRSVRMKDDGETEYVGGRFKVSIRRASLTVMIDSLLHEWAHALTWFGAETNIEDHSSEWSLCYGRIYRLFVEWDFGRGAKEKQ